MQGIHTHFPETNHVPREYIIIIIIIIIMPSGPFYPLLQDKWNVFYAWETQPIAST
jgi:hypothetical protein